MALSYKNSRTYIERMIKQKLRSSFITARPLLYVMAGSSTTGLDRLGDPNMGAWFGGANVGQATRSMMDGSDNHQWRFQKATNDNSEPIVGTESTPVASKFADDNVALAETRWYASSIPLKIRQHKLDNARSGLAIGKLIEEAMAMSFERGLTDLQSRFWTGTLTENQQDAEQWENLIGLTHICSDGTESTYRYYGGVDRLATHNQHLRANLYAYSALVSAGALATSKITLGAIRGLRTLNSIGGIANKNPKAGNLAITTPELWNTLATEAEGKHTIYDTGQKVPGLLSTVGTQYPVILKDTTLITYDPSCPSGELYLLTTDSFVYEIQGGYNFTQQGWVEKHKVEEGGGRYQWNAINVTSRLTCYDPYLQTRVTGLTVS